MRAGRDRGAGGVLVLLAVVLVGAAGLLAVLVGRALTVRHEVAAAADLAALAGAATLAENTGGPGLACASARRVAAANRAVVVGCSVQGAEVEVRAERVVRWFGGMTAVRGHARAGPPPLAAGR